MVRGSTILTNEQRARYVPPLARGQLIGAFALTETEAGSDAGALRTSATREHHGWRISRTSTATWPI